MVFRDLQIINKYAETCVKKKKKQLVKEDWQYIGSEIKATSDKLKPIIARRVVMSNLELANKRILDVLQKNGINEDKPLKIYEEAYNIAKNKENSGDLIKIADRYTELLDMKPQKVQYSETRKEINYDNMLPEQVTKKISINKSVENEEFSRVNKKECPNLSDKQAGDE